MDPVGVVGKQEGKTEKKEKKKRRDNMGWEDGRDNNTHTERIHTTSWCVDVCMG
jgi:hypothetical protein